MIRLGHERNIYVRYTHKMLRGSNKACIPSYVTNGSSSEARMSSWPSPMMLVASSGEVCLIIQRMTLGITVNVPSVECTWRSISSIRLIAAVRADSSGS
jgi:hypothetical protein